MDGTALQIVRTTCRLNCVERIQPCVDQFAQVLSPIVGALHGYSPRPPGTTPTSGRQFLTLKFRIGPFLPELSALRRLIVKV